MKKPGSGSCEGQCSGHPSRTTAGMSVGPPGGPGGWSSVSEGQWGDEVRKAGVAAVGRGSGFDSGRARKALASLKQGQGWLLTSCFLFFVFAEMNKT